MNLSSQKITSARMLSLKVGLRDRFDIYQDGVDDDFNEFNLPKLNICIMVVGTHGDVVPFCSIAKELQVMGHRVRLATHEDHRKIVSSQSIDFFALEGDPRQLSMWMVKSGGTILGEATNPRLIPMKRKMLTDIAKSCWPAVSQPDPLDPDAESFVADAVIANPVCFGEVHVCEALGIPLHIMFPQPWSYGTRSFPHPLSWRPKTGALNTASYTILESLLWLSFGPEVDRWRTRELGLPRIPLGPGFGTFIRDCEIPFSAMWSPSLLPKPEDWPRQCRVVGAFTQNNQETSCDNLVDKTKFKDLIQWLADGDKPVFIGFGSMVVDDTERLSTIIKETAKTLNTRIVVQSSWSNLDVSSEPLCQNVGPVAHDWLFPQCSAVVHHGGSGTTAAGLWCGLPTFICPFFGDQHIWGDMVHQAGVGPAPCPIKDLTTEILTEKLKELTCEATIRRTNEISRCMNKENGLLAGIQHFCDDLPVDNMMCDVSLILGESVVAKYSIQRDRIHISHEVATALATPPHEVHRASRNFVTVVRRIITKWISPLGQTEEFSPYRIRKYKIGSRSQSCMRGMTGACVESTRLCLKGIFQWVLRPVRFGRSNGALGCIFGLLVFPLYTLFFLLKSLVVFVDRTVVAFANSCFGREWHYFLDPTQRAKYRSNGTEQEVKFDAHMDSGRRAKIKVAKKIAEDSLHFFNHCRYVSDRKLGFRKASAETLLDEMKASQKLFSKLGLSEKETGILRARLKKIVENGPKDLAECGISFSRFCLFLGEALHIRWKFTNCTEATIREGSSASGSSQNIRCLLGIAKTMMDIDIDIDENSKNDEHDLETGATASLRDNSNEDSSFDPYYERIRYQHALMALPIDLNEDDAPDLETEETASLQNATLDDDDETRRFNSKTMN